MWEIRRYSKEDRDEWNAFIERARNSTFLFLRAYMDYHSHRFRDHSLMAYRRGKLAAVLPANVDNQTLCSHQGLTYGGWVLQPEGLDATEIFLLWKEWMAYCSSESIEKVIYKPLPYIYSEMPSQEDLYMLFLCGGRLISTDISTAIDLDNNPGFDKLQRRHLKKAIGDFMPVKIEWEDFEAIEEFHEMLSACLEERHSCTPVHTVEELKYLMKEFPDNISLWGACDSDGEKLLAGICIYETGMCAHCQYIATTSEGRERNILTPLVSTVIHNYEYEGTRYLDFGISNENGGRYLNAGLNRQKTSFGGSGVAYSRYEIEVGSALARLPETLWPTKP